MEKPARFVRSGLWGLLLLALAVGGCATTESAEWEADARPVLTPGGCTGDRTIGNACELQNECPFPVRGTIVCAANKPVCVARAGIDYSARQCAISASR
jgi:hypothetical protein